MICAKARPLARSGAGCGAPFERDGGLSPWVKSGRMSFLAGRAEPASLPATLYRLCRCRLFRGHCRKWPIRAHWTFFSGRTLLWGWTHRTLTAPPPLKKPLRVALERLLKVISKLALSQLQIRTCGERQRRQQSSWRWLHLRRFQRCCRPSQRTRWCAWTGCRCPAGSSR